jgi:methylated-DNA-[protein]-cysteine S-methyltransferase
MEILMTKTAWTGTAALTPIGPIWLACSTLGLAYLYIGADEAKFTAELRSLGFPHLAPGPAKAAPFLAQVVEYLNGQRRSFDLPIDWSTMNSFQEKALRATLAIPYGQTATYQQIALQVNSPRGARAVGRAEATNPIPLVIPCHRVLGSDGKLHGYGGGNGIETKAWLLKLESQAKS